MLRNRLFNATVAFLIIIVVILTAREAAATAGIISETDSTKGTEIVKCLSLPSRYSLRTEYVKEANIWIFRTEDGPTGVDGGLLDLMSDYRTCSR
jgi:hypothetical protein